MVVHRVPHLWWGIRVVPREPVLSSLHGDESFYFMEADMETPANASEFAQQLRTLVNNLIDALNSGDIVNIQKNQQAFSVAIEQAWQHFNRPDVPAKEKAIPRLIESWAQRDLMTEISDPVNHQKAIHDLKLFESSLILFE